MHVVEGEWGEASGRQVAGVWLGRLPEGWFVFHDVPAGERGATIEQVVIGPGGVFTITTKNLTGSIRVNPRSIVHDGHRTELPPEGVRGSSPGREPPVVRGRPGRARFEGSSRSSRTNGSCGSCLPTSTSAVRGA